MFSTFLLPNLLFLIIILPIFCSGVFFFISKKYVKILRYLAFFITFLVFFFSLFFWIFFDRKFAQFQFVYDFVWVSNLNFNLSLGVDGISIFFLLLTTFLIPICILSSWNSIKFFYKEFIIAILLLESLLVFVFCVKDLLLFYIFFESILIPMFIIIGIWGSRERKIKASYLFFLYTLIGSVLMLLSILFIYFKVGTTEYENLVIFEFNLIEQKFIWLAFFCSFASKIPMFPVHIWLPEAHVEAPTVGSVILAGILLKLGVYGFIRFSLPILPKASLFFTPFIFTLAIIGILYSSLTAIRQIDLKRIIAYTSIAHMNLVVVGIFSFNILGLEGAIFQSLSHGFVSSSLFFLIGVIYDRHHTRLIKYYSGLTHTMPVFSIFFLIFTMANIGLPGTSSFVGEFLILCGSFKTSIFVCFLAAFGMVLSGGYSLWLFNRVVYGNLKIQYLKNFQDLNLREFMIFLPLVLITIITGIFPEIFLEIIHNSVIHLLNIMKL